MSDLEHIHPDFRHVMSLSDKERIDFLHQPRWISYRVANEVSTLLVDLLSRPIRLRMPNLLIVGDSNNGKSTLVNHFHAKHGEGYVNEDGDAIKPVILAEAPSKADERGLYVAILERLFVAFRPTDPVAKLRSQVVHLLRACRVRMLIIDEFHSMLTGSALKQREVMNTLRNLCNVLAVPIVGVGTRDAVRVLHTDPQLASRFDVVALPLFTLDVEFQKLLARFQTILPLKIPSNLHQPELAKRLHLISAGNLGDLHRLLIESATQAIKTGQERIDATIIESKAWLRPTRGIRELIR